mmetsp:Transcript_34442/g.82179  ORF Transcript_34442/g.82179 Transcript_34442/m.82179 type:complete len:211 (-) Transcript_34442:733-1365(-)
MSGTVQVLSACSTAFNGSILRMPFSCQKSPRKMTPACRCTASSCTLSRTSRHVEREVRETCRSLNTTHSLGGGSQQAWPSGRGIRLRFPRRDPPIDTVNTSPCCVHPPAPPPPPCVVASSDAAAAAIRASSSRPSASAVCEVSGAAATSAPLFPSSSSFLILMSTSSPISKSLGSAASRPAFPAFPAFPSSGLAFASDTDLYQFPSTLFL